MEIPCAVEKRQLNAGNVSETFFALDPVEDVGSIDAREGSGRLIEKLQTVGFGSPDDAEGWERMQQGAAAGDDLWIMVSRGIRSSDVSAETGMRAAYAMWKKLMQGSER